MKGSENMAICWISHRGESADAPENTLKAFALAMERNSDGMECDVRFTSDRVVLCSHDDNTGRMGSESLIVADTPYAKLAALDMSGGMPGYKGEGIARFEDTLKVLKPGKKYFVEIKVSDPEILSSVRNFVRNAGIPAEQIIIIAFDKEVIRNCSSYCPEFKTLWLTGFQELSPGRFSPSAPELIAILRDIGADGVDAHGNLQVIDENYVRQLKKEGFYFAVWTVDDEADARRFMALGVDSITSNRAASLKEKLGQ